MRQAGRWDPEFNRVRNGLSFYEFSENVELSAKASLLPRRFGVDGIISREVDAPQCIQTFLQSFDRVNSPRHGRGAVDDPGRWGSALLRAIRILAIPTCSSVWHICPTSSG